MEDENELFVSETLDEFGDPITPGAESEDQSSQEEQEDEQSPIAEESENSDDDQEQEPETQEEQSDDKGKPKGEKSSYHAEQRRIREQQQREQIINEYRQQSPEFQVAQMLEKMYGMPVDQLQQKLLEANMAKQAQERNVPVEVVQREHQRDQEVARMQTQIIQMEFDRWRQRIETEATALKNDFPMLSDEDFTAAQNHLLTVIKNVNVPLEEAVMSLHGRKIMKHMQEQNRTEALAEVSGRKKSALPPQSSKTSDSKVLTDEQRAAAKVLGMSEAEYLKWSVD